MTSREPLWPRDPVTRFGRAVLRAAGRLVPSADRREWLDEWEAELWQIRTGDAVSSLGLFLIGALWHASNEWKEGWRMESIGQDVRYAIRTLQRSPGFAAAAVVMLASSIGASAALFSVLEQALLADPPFPEPDRLVVVDQQFGQTADDLRAASWSYPRFRDLGNEVHSLDAVGGYALHTMTLTELGDPAIVSVEAVTPSLLPLLGVDAARGRLFTVGEEDAGSPIPVALVSHAFWQTRLGGDPDAVGSSIALDRVRLEVLGVLPPRFNGITGDADVWVPMSALRSIEDDGFLDDPWNLHFSVVGRLAPGATLASARSELDGFAATLKSRYPAPVGASRLAFGVDVVPFREARSNPEAKASMLALFAAVLLVLLVATANLAGLLLARSAKRQHEAALRSSLGAGRGRLLRQFITESLVLAFLGGAGGLVLARYGVDVLGTWLAGALGTTGGRGLQYLDTETLTVSWSVLGFALALTTGVGIAFGLLPAWQASRADPNASLRGGRSDEGARRWSLGRLGRSGLIVVQVAVAIVLLTGATVMMRTMSALQSVDLGYDRANLFTAMYSLTSLDELSGIDPATFHLDFLDRIRTLPGVDGATLGEVPQGGPTWTTIVLGSDGRPELEAATHTWIRLQPVPEGHLRVLGVELLEGREIEATDDADSEPVVVINELAAQELFPDGNPIGQRIRLGWPELDGGGATVVGVSRTVQLGALGGPPERQAFVSIRQAPRLQTGVIIRSTRPFDDLERAVRAALAELGPNTALTSVMSMEERVADVTARPRVVTMLLGVFSSLALFLVAAGLYGTIAFVVTSRTRELGLRLSLGADRRSILALVLRQSLGVTVLGIAIGAAVALWSAGFLRGVSLGGEGLEWTSLVPVSAVLFAVAFIAAYVPARRAMRIDPTTALRSE